MSASPRERFCMALMSAELIKADAIVLLAGEDGEARAAAAAEFMRMGGAPIIVVTGGLDDPPARHGATRLTGILTVVAGCNPDRIRIDDAATNTREQAANTVALARAEGWTSLLLVASPYHAPRAFLTFVQALCDVKADQSIKVCCAAASQVRWFQPPPGCTATRLELLEEEFHKVSEYHKLGHVATYRAGLAYLEAWEGQ